MNYVYAAVGALSIFLVATVLGQHQSLNAKAETIKALTAERDSATLSRDAHKTSATTWELAATQCNLDAEMFKKQQATNLEQNKQLLAVAQAKANALQTDLSKANARITAASRAGPCATILNTPVCAEALQ